MSTRLTQAALVAVLSSLACACTSPDLPPVPPGAPQQNETVISGEDDPVSIQCSGDFGNMWTRPGQENPRRVLVTNAPEWGTIWRSDAAPSDDPGHLWRIVCWKQGALLRPLQMLDASQSIPPLP